MIPDEYIEKLNGMQNKWVAGKNFDSVEQVIPLLGAWKDQRSEEERFYRKGSLYAASNYEGKDEITNNHKSQFLFYSKCKTLTVFVFITKAKTISSYS